jgi:hypothetical protein
MSRNFVPSVIGGPPLLNQADPAATIDLEPQGTTVASPIGRGVILSLLSVTFEGENQMAVLGEGHKMVKRKLICRVALTRYGVEKFEAAVNDHLAKGWEPIAIEVDQKLFRVVCFALLGLPTHCTCQCSCCTGEGRHDADCACACDCCMAHSDQTVKEPDDAKEEGD